MHADFEALREELEQVLGGLDERQTQLKPAQSEARWSIQRIVGHLMLTYAATERAIDSRIAKGTPTKAKPSPTQRIGQFILLRIGYFPRGRVAPDAVVAPVEEPAVPGGVLIARSTEAIASMNRKVAAGEAAFGAKNKAISHIVLGPLSVEQWRRFHLIHGRHHIRQIAAIRGIHGV